MPKRKLFLVPSISERKERAATVVRSGGIITINEALEALGLAPLPDTADKYFKIEWPLVKRNNEYGVYAVESIPAPVEKEPEPELEKPKITTRKLEM